MTLFSFGYFGWGNATTELVWAVNAVEADRGFNPPLWVDTRIRRSVRARGFQGPAFERVASNALWMPELGNKHIVSRSGPRIQIAEPAAAATLLDHALADPSRRVIFFCGCEWPRVDGEVACHRVEVGQLVRQEAARRGTAVTVTEWPGGEPVEASLTTPPAVIRAVKAGRASVPLPAGEPMALWAGLPWGSVLSLTAGDERTRVLSGPARVRGGGWQMPVIGLPGKGAQAFRQARGLD